MSQPFTTRLEALLDRTKNHPIYQKLGQRLTEAEFDRIVEFIEDHDQLGHLEFEYAVNRMFLDGAPRPKNWGIIQELLTIVNTAAKGRYRSA